MTLERTKNLFIILMMLLCLLGVVLRFYDITENQFVYYDEGMYLDHTRNLLYNTDQSPPQTFSEYAQFFNILTHVALHSNKFLWFFIAGLRWFIVGADGLFFTRIISAFFGSLSLIVIYLFGKRFYGNQWVGLLAAGMLALLPSHIYYSRLGLQETFSAFCFLLGIYFYIFSKGRKLTAFFSGILFSSVYLTNYRMIVLPVLLIFTEWFLSFTEEEKFDYKKILWSLAAFAGIILIVSTIYGGVNFTYTSAWVFHQAGLAEGHFNLLSLFSYPFYVFKLESLLFGLAFFGSFYFLNKNQTRMLYPFLLVCFQMLIFSFPEEKGARFICVVMPFMALAVSVFICRIVSDYKEHKGRWIIFTLLLIMSAWHIYKGFVIAGYTTDYKSMMDVLTEKNKNIKVLSTQPLVQNLYTEKGRNVQSAPKELSQLVAYFYQGYSFIAIDPQAYIMNTANGRRFSPTLDGYLNFILTNVRPVKVYPHFSNSLLERFVLEHNVNLKNSISFLSSNNNGQYNVLRVYDIDQCLAMIKQRKNM